MSDKNKKSDGSDAAEDVPSVDESRANTDTAETLIEDATAGDEPEHPAESDTPDELEDSSETGDEIEADEATTATEQITPPPAAPAKRSGFGGLVMGGVIAAALGAGAAIFAFPDGLRSTVSSDIADLRASAEASAAEQNARIGALESAVNGIDVPDISGVEAALEEQTQSTAQARDTLTEIAASLDDLTARFSDLDARLTELEKRPVEQGVSQAAIAAYQRELQALQDSVSRQREEIEAMASTAAEAEASAAVSVQAAMARAALTRILTALDSGEPFAAALADFSAAGGGAVPDALSAVAEDGVASLAELRADFPTAARSALAAARKGGEAEDTAGRLTTFLQNQLGARSVAPRDGDDPDAILSRAEAALSENRLTDCLAELDTLPELAKTEMAEWVSVAERRQAAVEAADEMAQRLSGQ